MITELNWKLCGSGVTSGFSWDWRKTMKSLLSAQMMCEEMLRRMAIWVGG
jgi:hypothetical protein